MEEILEKLKKAVLEGEDDLALSLVNKALEEGYQPLVLVNQALVPGIRQAGELWKKNVYFQSDVIMSVEAFRVTMEVVEPLLKAEEMADARKVVIGTVAGDMHNLGKMIVVAMLRGAGFSVTDLGEDVPTPRFIDAVRDMRPAILGMGCYMTTTMLEMRDVMKGLADAGLRDKVKVLIGGVPTTQKFAEEIGADGWGKDALDAVGKANELVG
ncbi:MAG: cobalamin B12-binding domain-containing protein [Chloroflexi bacterium]|nr:cobalamin B12-binding domain-containing protein [Chloroflexota bacterium]